MKDWKELNKLTCIVIGGGYAGINAVNAIRKNYRKLPDQQPLRIILIDKHLYHLRKVLLFKAAAGGEEITIPLSRIFPEDVEFVQGTVTHIQSDSKTLRYVSADGDEHLLSYDKLVVALGSVIRQPTPDLGGIALTGLEAAEEIHKQWSANFRQALTETNEQERRRLLTVAVAGAGISGIETSAELANTLRSEAETLGIDPKDVNIYLLNAGDRLFQAGPIKVGAKLEQILHDSGITVLHRRKAVRESNGVLSLSNGEQLSVGLCIWTLGVQPNPALQSFGLPLTPEGEVIVDASYRVPGAEGIYSIGDCARIIDPATGLADGKTCKEGSAQSNRLGQIICADLLNSPAPSHKGYIDLFCFGLGPERGMVWTRLWGLNIILTGKIGWKIRKLTWDYASLLK